MEVIFIVDFDLLIIWLLFLIIRIFLLIVFLMFEFFNNKVRFIYFFLIIFICNDLFILCFKENWMEFIGVGVIFIVFMLMLFNILVFLVCFIGIRFEVCGIFMVVWFFFCFLWLVCGLIFMCMLFCGWFGFCLGIFNFCKRGLKLK